jgi:hypothetical protein
VLLQQCEGVLQDSPTLQHRLLRSLVLCFDLQLILVPMCAGLVCCCCCRLRMLLGWS